MGIENRACAESSNWSMVRDFLRREAFSSGNPEKLKGFLTLPKDARLWPYTVNGDIRAVAVTSGCKIEAFHFCSKLLDGHFTAVVSILGAMMRANIKVVWMDQNVDLPDFWKRCGFENVSGMLVADLEKPNDGGALKQVKGTSVQVDVKFRQSAGPQLPMPIVSRVKGVLTADQYLYLETSVVAFDPTGTVDRNSLWISVHVDGEMRADYRLTTKKCEALGLEYDAVGTPYVSKIDLFAPTVL